MKSNVLGNNLKKLRKNNGYKQSYVAQELGISEATISKYENGKQDPSYDILIKLANFYNESLDFIFSRDKFVAMVNSDDNIIRVSEDLHIFIDSLQKDEFKKLLEYIEKDPEQSLKLIFHRMKQYL